MAEGPVMEGLMLMGVGMTTVFAFLILMVLAMFAQGTLFRRYDIEYVPGRTSVASPVSQADAHLPIAIALAAIEAHRRRQSP
jgi:sodium pump decarboxylase gamma subunit